MFDVRKRVAGDDPGSTEFEFFTALRSIQLMSGVEVAVAVVRGRVI